MGKKKEVKERKQNKKRKQKGNCLESFSVMPVFLEQLLLASASR